LMNRCCRSTKHHSRQNGKYTFVDEHKLTPIDVVRSRWTKSRVKNSIPDHMLRAQSHLHFRGPSPQAQSNFQSTPNLLTPTIKLTQAQTVRRKPDCTI
jgi:hypothetical protein